MFPYQNPQTETFPKINSALSADVSLEYSAPFLRVRSAGVVYALERPPGVSRRFLRRHRDAQRGVFALRASERASFREAFPSHARLTLSLNMCMRRMPNRATKPARLTLVRQLKTLHRENGWSEEGQAVWRNKGAREITQKHLGEEISSADRLGPRSMVPFRKTALLRSLNKCRSDEDGYFNTGVSRYLAGPHAPLRYYYPADFPAPSSAQVTRK